MRSNEMQSSFAKYIWYEENGIARNVYVKFRKKFTVKGNIRTAVLHLFADTHYQLYVNGTFIEHGPARFDPRFPEYDTHDLSGLLRTGANVIAVHVQHVGHHTFKHIPNRGGFIAWGDVKWGSKEDDAEDGVLSLTTEAGSWLCTLDRAHMTYTGKSSFALPAREIVIQQPDEAGWKEPEFDDSQWMPATEISKQQAWGELKPRSIPYMKGTAISPEQVLDVLPLTSKEKLYSFEVATPHCAWFEEDKNISPYIAFGTWIYSPVSLSVTAGTFYGDYWINGVKSEEKLMDRDKSMRMNHRWNLEAGWNAVFGCIDIFQDVYHHYLALPSDKGLIVSADRDPSSRRRFRRSRLITAAQADEWLQGNPHPVHPDSELSELGGWVFTDDTETAGNPCFETGWDNYESPFEALELSDISGRTFEHLHYPNGFSILLDFGATTLSVPSITISGVRGATIDITYSEHLNADERHLRLEHYYGLGDRIICVEDELQWRPMEPRGCRYMMLTVRNAGSDITILDLSFRSASYPGNPTGSLHCSDPLLNRIWELGKQTLAVNMEDAYVDCVTRERGMYGRDTIIQYHVNLAVYGDQKLMRRSMELFAQSPAPTGKFRACYPTRTDYTIADFALNMVEGFWTYYEQTGDREFLHAYWPAILNNLNWFHELADEREDLLLDADWPERRHEYSPYGGFHGDLAVDPSYMSRSGIHCVFSMIYYLALISAQRIAAVIGDNNERKRLQRRTDILSRTIPETFWNESMGCFSDNSEHQTFSAHASLFAIRASLVSQDRWDRVKTHISKQLDTLFVNGVNPEDGVKSAPDFAFYLLDGLYRAGMSGTAEQLIKQGWGWFLSKGLRTCPEYFRTDLSLCHAWAAHPTYYLSKYLLGVNYPAAPDLDHVDICVQTNGVTHAEGMYPHPRGSIYVKWHMEGIRRIYDEIQAPEGVRIHISDPLCLVK